MGLPLLKQRIFKWFPNFASVSASTAGAKNIASSSGWAMRRQMRFSRSWGNDARATCAVYIQHVMRTTGIAKTKKYCIVTVRLRTGRCKAQKASAELVDGKS